MLILREAVGGIWIPVIVAALCAAHPVQVESVAWISGVPDLLFSLALLASLWFADSYSKSGSAKHLALTAVLYALALGAKEIGIICVPLYYLLLIRDRGDKQKKVEYKTPLLLLAGIAAGWFVLRMSILGGFSNPPEDAVGFGTAILSIPSMFAFYLRQIFFPYWLSVNYPLEPVTAIGLCKQENSHITKI